MYKVSVNFFFLFSIFYIFKYTHGPASFFIKMSPLKTINILYVFNHFSLSFLCWCTIASSVKLG